MKTVRRTFTFYWTCRIFFDLGFGFDVIPINPCFSINYTPLEKFWIVVDSILAINEVFKLKMSTTCWCSIIHSTDSLRCAWSLGFSCVNWILYVNTDLLWVYVVESLLKFAILINDAELMFRDFHTLTHCFDINIWTVCFWTIGVLSVSNWSSLWIFQLFSSQLTNLKHYFDQILY